MRSFLTQFVLWTQFSYFQVSGYKVRSCWTRHDTHSSKKHFSSAGGRELTYWHIQHTVDWLCHYWPSLLVFHRLGRGTTVLKQCVAPDTAFSCSFLSLMLCNCWWTVWCDYVGNILTIIVQMGTMRGINWEVTSYTIPQFFIASCENTRKIDFFVCSVFWIRSS